MDVFERILTAILNFGFYALPPIVFIIFMILDIIQIRKLKRGEGRKGKVIAFSIVSGVAFLYTAAEALLVIFLSMAIAHM